MLCKIIVFAGETKINSVTLIVIVNVRQVSCGWRVVKLSNFSKHGYITLELV